MKIEIFNEAEIEAIADEIATNLLAEAILDRKGAGIEWPGTATIERQVIRTLKAHNSRKRVDG